MNVDHYLRWLSNHTVVKYSEQRHVVERTREGQRSYIASFNVGEYQNEESQLWEIQRTGVPIGSVTAHTNVPNKSANIGIMLGEPKVWGTGYGIEAWMAVTEYLFDKGIRKVEAGCMASNGPMISVLNKAEFTKEATLPNYFLLDGKPEDMLYYGKYSQAKIIPFQSAAAKMKATLRPSGTTKPSSTAVPI
jgi:RimJ/RimL family protein N-acetyltransferase